MVVFTCFHCGDSVKKPGVQKHYQFKCKNQIALTCMDCLKDFDGNSYQVHTKCVSEEQRYSGKDYVPKKSDNAGMKKQQQWVEVVKSIIQNPDAYKITPDTKQILQRIKNYENIPRKKPKFENFLCSCLRVKKDQAGIVWKVMEQALNEYHKKIGENQKKPLEGNANKAAEKNVQSDDNGELWTVEPVQKKRKKEKKEKEEQCTSNGNGDQGDDANTSQNDVSVELLKKKKKKKIDGNAWIESDEKKEISTNLKAEEFKLAIVVRKLIKKRPNGINFEELKEKVFKKYKSYHNTKEIPSNVQKKFNKKIKKFPFLVIEGDIVKMTK